MARTMAAIAMEYLPVGFRFHPTEEELLGHHLKRKNLGLEEPDCVIPEVDPFRWEPEELQAKFTESSIVVSKDLECWFFYEHKPGQVQGRSTRGGYWKKTGRTRDIKSRNGTRQVMGSKKILTFYRGNRSSSSKTDWVMHEYHLASNALDGLFCDDSWKNYVVCLIKCDTDCELDEPTTAEITNILEAEADYGFILEESLHVINPNLHQELAQFMDHSNNAGDSCGSEFSLGRDPVALDLPSSAGEYSASLTVISNQVLVDTDEHPSVGEVLTSPTGTGDLFTTPDSYALVPASDNPDDDIFETLWPTQELVVILESEQTPELESLHGFVPLDEEKDIAENDISELSACLLQMETPKMRSKKELTQMISCVPSEAKALPDDSSKIEEEIVSAVSSSSSTRKPRKRATAKLFGGHTSDASTSKKKEIKSSVTALHKPAKPARGLILMTAKRRSCSLRHSSSRRCSCREPSVAGYWYLLVAMILSIAICIFREDDLYPYGYGPSRHGQFRFRVSAKFAWFQLACIASTTLLVLMLKL